MRVCVDEPGDDGVCGEVSDRDAGGRGISDGLDAVNGDQNVGVGMDGACADIDEFAGEHGLRHHRWGRLLSVKYGNGKEEGDKETAA